VALVYLVQHGEKEPLPGDPGLTDMGRQQATRSGRWLTSRAGACVVQQPSAAGAGDVRMLRCTRTASAILAGAVNATSPSIPAVLRPVLCCVACRTLTIL